MTVRVDEPRPSARSRELVTYAYRRNDGGDDVLMGTIREVAKQDSRRPAGRAYTVLNLDTGALRTFDDYEDARAFLVGGDT